MSIEKWQSELLGLTRRRFVFAIGFIVTVDTIEWVGKWFKYVEIEEELHKERYLNFDEWNYQFYWGPWESVWGFKRIIG